MTTAIFKTKREISIFLVLNMLLSFLIITAPPVKAGIMSTVGSLAKGIVVTGGSIAGALVGGTLGIAVGGGPIGMVLGGAAGYFVSGKVLNWLTANCTNAGTFAGAVAGGALCLGLGFPVVLCGLLAGGVIGHIVGGMIDNATGGGAQAMVSVAASDAQAQSFIDHMMAGDGTAPAAPTDTAVSSGSGNSTSGAAAAPDQSQSAYENYLSSYKAYTDAVQKGDDKTAQKCLADYQKYYSIYQSTRK
ncbi:MAG: hypothetical protein HQM08_26260 [Candidatus Riflebacteria bacterium]|nr:hypothetical protein [Candidatus Riflebacteria bacterium]